jgi:hypothetical protein
MNHTRRLDSGVIAYRRRLIFVRCGEPDNQVGNK